MTLLALTLAAGCATKGPSPVKWGGDASLLGGVSVTMTSARTGKDVGSLVFDPIGMLQLGADALAGWIPALDGLLHPLAPPAAASGGAITG